MFDTIINALPEWLRPIVLSGPVLVLITVGLSFFFFFLFLVFRPLEAAFPARKGQKFFRPEWWTDLTFFLGQYLLWSGLVLWLLVHIGGWINGGVPTGFRAVVSSQPYWLQAVEVILINLPVFLLGFPVETLAGLIAFRGIWAIYIHSNLRLPIGPLRWFIGAPELHHWHHDKARDAGNYANISPLMDLLFGTYRCPGHEPDEFGIHEPIPRSYVAQMIHPFKPKQD